MKKNAISSDFWSLTHIWEPKSGCPLCFALISTIPVLITLVSDQPYTSVMLTRGSLAYLHRFTYVASKVKYIFDMQVLKF